MRFRTKALPAALLVMAAPSLASAADLPSRKGPVYAPAVPVFTWEGFYIGVQGGYTSGRDSIRTFVPGLAGFFPILPNTAVNGSSSTTRGFVAGAYAGYNWQVGSAFVVGTESDIEFSNARSNGVFNGFNIGAGFPGGLGAPLGSANVRTDWRGSSRIRLGYSFGRALVYVTGGGAYASFRFNNFYNSQFAGAAGFVATNFVNENYRNLRLGGTIGAGVEYAITDNWLARVEYRYTDFGRNKEILNGSPLYVQEHRLSDHAIRAGIAYKFGGGGLLGNFLPFLALAPAPGAANWTGIKLGAQVGYASERDRNNMSSSVLAAALVTPFASASLGNFSSSPSGFVGGGHLGYDYQWGRLVSGVEVDVEGAALRGTAPIGGFTPGVAGGFGFPIGTVTTRNDWRGAAMARIGYAFDRMMIYATSGLAVGNFRFNSIYNPAFLALTGAATGFANESYSKFRLGSAYGVGLEYAVTDNWSTRVEYRYTDFGKFREILNTSALGYVQQHRIYDNSIRAGFSYKFGPPIVPVVARY